jgi:DegV family protein with EDD domain
MSDIRIVTDSTAYLPADIVAGKGIRVVPLLVNFDTEVFREGADLSNDEFYRRLTTEDKLPTTSQPSVGDFKTAYQELADAGAKGIISLHIAEGISGTVQSARAAAAEMQGIEISVVNSRMTGVALALMLLRAVEEIEAGKSQAEVVKMLEDLSNKIHIYFVVDTLEYLHKGGRIGGAKAFMGSVLNIKPILELQDHIEPVGKGRGRAKALAEMLEIAKKQLGGAHCRYGLTHTREPQYMKELQKQIVDALDCDPEPLLINETGPVIGTHVGPGTLGISFYAD